MTTRDEIGALPPDAIATLLRSERVFLAARDVAEIEFRKHYEAGVSLGGSVTAATRAALDVAIGAIFDGAAVLPQEAGAPPAVGQLTLAMLLRRARTCVPGYDAFDAIAAFVVAQPEWIGTPSRAPSEAAPREPVEWLRQVIAAIPDAKIAAHFQWMGWPPSEDEPSAEQMANRATVEREWHARCRRNLLEFLLSGSPAFRETPPPITAEDVLRWMRNRPGESWKATISDIEEVLAKIGGAASRPEGDGAP